MKEFVKVLFPIWRVFCSEYCSEVIALSKECEKRRETSARLSDVCFENLCTVLHFQHTKICPVLGVVLDTNWQSEG